MAKLCARGRTELARATHECDEPGQKPSMQWTGDGKQVPVGDPWATVWRRTERALMSDGNVLEKMTIRCADGRRHDWGWRVRGKLKDGMGTGDWVSLYQRKGWVIEASDEAFENAKLVARIAELKARVAA